MTRDKLPNRTKHTTLRIQRRVFLLHYQGILSLPYSSGPNRTPVP